MEIVKILNNFPVSYPILAFEDSQSQIYTGPEHDERLNH